MTKIYVTKLSETYIYVESSEEIESEISEHFSFLVEGYKFMPAFKNGKWDGYIRLYNPYIKKLYTGLLPGLYDFANMHNYTIVEDGIDSTQDYSDDYIANWLDSQVLHANGKQISMRDYQYNVVFEFLKTKRIVVRAATNAGKSLIIYLICKFFTEHDKKVLVQTDSTNLVEQLYNDFKDYSVLNKFDVDYHSQKITSDYRIKELHKSIVISTWQSQYSALKKDNNHVNEYFDCIINDETHKADAKSITAIFESCHNVKWRIGLTGSLKKTKLNKLALQGLIGRIYQSITTREMIDRGESCNLNINILMLDYDAKTKKFIRDKEREKDSENKFDYGKLSEFIRNCPERNKFIVKLAVSKPGNSLILFNHEEHGLELVRIHKELYPDIPVFFINGSVSGTKREEIRNQIETLEKCTVIGSYGTVSTGWSVKRLHNLILGFPYKAITRILQSIGRMLRTHHTKSAANIFDISDILSNNKTAIFNRQTQSRAEIYIEEQLSFKTYKIEIKTDALF